MGTTAAAAVATDDTRLVQVWFGDHVVASHTAPPDEAAHYAELMGRRFAGLRVTITTPDSGETTTPLPPPALWDRGPT